MDVEKIAASLTEAQRKLLRSRKRPNDYRAVEALALERLGLLCFTPMGDVISTPLGLAVRTILERESNAG